MLRRMVPDNLKSYYKEYYDQDVYTKIYLIMTEFRYTVMRYLFEKGYKLKDFGVDL